MISFMSFDMDENLVKVLLDTNILISAMVFGGKPKQILNSILEEEFLAITSPILLAELKEVLNKKFPQRETDFTLTIKNIEEIFRTIQPKEIINILRDDDDNRVLEAAIEGNCEYIVTGDKELLRLKSYQNVKIVTAGEVLKLAKF